MNPGLFSFGVLLLLTQAAACAAVSVLRTPNEGIQPQVAVDGSGTIHLIYYAGSPEGGDIFYVRRPAGQSEFSKAIRVNGVAGSAIALGTIRGAQLALGKGGRVHVLWNGMGRGALAVPVGGKQISPLLYTRLNIAGTAFEPERNLITTAPGLDGGSSVAADSKGNVLVTWHAPQPGKSDEDEADRSVFIRLSRNEGETFEPEMLATTTPTGACACCGMRAWVDKSGFLYILFRSATGGLSRDAVLLVAKKPGAEFVIVHKDEWKITTCPMSSATITEAPGGAIAAWETAGQVLAALINPETMKVSDPLRPPGDTIRKHPVAVRNEAGETLLVWTEGTAWGKGGVMAYQLFNEQGQPGSVKGRAEGLPAWSLATACVTQAGDFLIFH